MSNTSVEVSILLVEDDEVDQEAVIRAFHKERIANAVVTASDGEEALRILRGEHPTKHLGRPYVVLLDLNMPRMNGHQFLEELRSDPSISDSIVFVLTTSDDDRDKVEAYKANIAGYLVKSKVGVGFLKMVGMLRWFWRVVEFPPEQTNE